MAKNSLIKLLLSILNTNWLNPTPARYGFINGLDAVSYEELENNVIQNPHMLVRDLVAIMDKSKLCSIFYPHVHENGDIRPINDEDINDLKNL